MTFGKTILLAGLLCAPTLASSADVAIGDIDAAPHNYKTRSLSDRFTRLIPRFENEAALLDRTNEKAFLLSLLKILEVPVTSQMLVFSTTSLQLSLISPSNPRALYFNEDVYVGYIPGGRIEIVSLDPELGGIFYIFDIPREDRPLRFERSNRCMNCHAGEETGFVPGIVIKSVIPGPTGGSLDAFRLNDTGHTVPLTERFGGWHLTGKHNLEDHLGNLTGRFVAGNLTKITNAPGQRFNFAKYPVATSDILPHLLHEHQAGFVNRVVKGAYVARTPNVTDEQLDREAREIVSYILFANEAALPTGGIEPDAAYKEDFLRDRKTGATGDSLKDLELSTRLFKFRCSYMIYSPVFSGLPRDFKRRIFDHLQAALSIEEPHRDFSYLPADEKRAIAQILDATLPDFRRPN